MVGVVVSGWALPVDNGLLRTRLIDGDAIIVVVVVGRTGDGSDRIRLLGDHLFEKALGQLDYGVLTRRQRGHRFLLPRNDNTPPETLHTYEAGRGTTATKQFSVGVCIRYGEGV
jgi:hypothetical protein